MKFESAIDKIYTAVLIFAGIFGIVSTNLMFLTGFWYYGILLLVIFVLLYWLALDTNIYLCDDKMQIKMAFIHKNIKYEDIKEIKRAKNVISSFATSVKRIGIRTRDKKNMFLYTYISPKDEDKFISELKSKVNKETEFTGFDNLEEA